MEIGFPYLPKYPNFPSGAKGNPLTFPLAVANNLS